MQSYLGGRVHVPHALYEQRNARIGGDPLIGLLETREIIQYYYRVGEVKHS